MGFIPLILLFLFGTLQGEELSLRTKILYGAKAGDVPLSIRHYLDYVNQTGQQDFDLLRQLLLATLIQGANSEDDEIKLLAYIGSGFSLSDEVEPILERGLFSKEPKHQVVCLNFLSKMMNDKADASIKLLLKNAHPLIQLEALYLLSEKRHPAALSYAEAYMNKMPPEVRPFFPLFFAAIGTPQATTILKKLLSDPDEKVRTEAVIATATKGRDDLLPQYRRLLKQISPLQQEVVAAAIGMMKDEKSLERLAELALSKSPFVATASAHSLYSMGFTDYRQILEEGANSQFLYSIFLLKDVKESVPLLKTLLTSKVADVRLNAAVSLLIQRDPSCLNEVFRTLLPRDDQILVRISSPGRALHAFKWIGAEEALAKAGDALPQLSLQLRISLLRETINLPSEQFLQIANEIFEREKLDLIPQLLILLENVHTKEALDLIRSGTRRLGAPYIRLWCALSLARLGEEGPYKKQIAEWLRSEAGVDMMKMLEPVPFEMRAFDGSFAIQPQDKGLLFVEAVEMLTMQREPEDIALLLELLEKGNPKNLTILAGLLMRAIE